MHFERSVKKWPRRAVFKFLSPSRLPIPPRARTARVSSLPPKQLYLELALQAILPAEVLAGGDLAGGVCGGVAVAHSVGGRRIIALRHC